MRAAGGGLIGCNQVMDGSAEGVNMLTLAECVCVCVVGNVLTVPQGFLSAVSV